MSTCEDRGSRPSSTEKSQNLGFHRNTGSDPLKNYKAAKSAFNVEPSSAFRWPADDSPLIVIFECPLPSSPKNCQIWTPSDITSAHVTTQTTSEGSYEPVYLYSVIRNFAASRHKYRKYKM